MSLPFTARDVVVWSGGTLFQGSGDARFDAVSIDSREIAAGALFIAIRGPNHDAHDFLETASSAGAAGLLIEGGRSLPASIKPDCAVVAVDDTTRALAHVAAGHRAGFTGALVAITGSNGKTTTKEMCATILAERAPCLRNVGNLNNQFGLPLTLLSREAHHESVVVEIGMNHRGEVAALAAIARPTVGVITNVGVAHIEHLGSREEIAREKGDLVASLTKDGVAVLNADDPRVAAAAERTEARVVSFGLDAAALVRAEAVRLLPEGGFAFRLVAPAGSTDITVLGLGSVTVPNALAAAAAAMAAGASLDEVRHGLANYRPLGGRMERLALPGGGVLVNDSYNANPQSMQEALRSLVARSGGKRALAVLGEMGELGDLAARAHREIGALAAELDLDGLFTLGAHGRELADGAIAAGMDAARIYVATDHDDLAARVTAALRPEDWVLVKGSRAARMERVVNLLTRSGEGD